MSVRFRKRQSSSITGSQDSGDLGVTGPVGGLSGSTVQFLNPAVGYKGMFTAKIQSCTLTISSLVGTLDRLPIKS